MQSSHLEELQILGQAVLALVLGGIVGWERESAGKWAGLRTHMLVCLSAMLFVRVGQLLIQFYQQLQLGSTTLRTDPVRLIEAIVTGIAFIGTGTVLRDPESHRAEGLTTAAALLAVAPIGIAVAIEKYILAFGLAILIVAVLRLLTHLDQRITKSPHHAEKPDKTP